VSIEVYVSAGGGGDAVGGDGGGGDAVAVGGVAGGASVLAKIFTVGTCQEVISI
jgi:hypothetical protein